MPQKRVNFLNKISLPALQPFLSVAQNLTEDEKRMFSNSLKFKYGSATDTSVSIFRRGFKNVGAF